MNWLTRLLPSIKSMGSKKDIPDGLWDKCHNCQSIIYRLELERNLFICPKCGHHMLISARRRLSSFLDPQSVQEIAPNVVSHDPLKFRDTKKYKDRLSQAQKKTNEKSALIVQQGTLLTMPIVVSAFNFSFIGGSMGSAVGAKFVEGINVAMRREIPFVCFVASGGARMQEGVVSLLQMAKVSAAIAKLRDKHLPYITVLTNPTMGGVSASLAMLADIIIAEPNALIGFAGPRVIAETVKEKLPEGFQRSDFLLEHGAIDAVIDRRDLRLRIARLLAKLTKQKILGVET
jgi:acetyl-CoA carboxylase carboxyl transferase subunit beta